MAKTKISIIAILALVVILVISYFIFNRGGEVKAPEESGQAGYEAFTTVEGNNDIIKLFKPKPNYTVRSPFVVMGQARGSWYFEADFPVKLLDNKGNVIAQSIARAQGDWMTNDYVPFEVELQFQIPVTSEGTLVLEKDNPSGLGENVDELRIPLILEKLTEPEKRQIKLYYYNEDLDRDKSGNLKCSRQGLAALDREIPLTNTPIQDSIRLLLKGELSSQEKKQGLTTEYPLEGFVLKEAALTNGVLTLEFDDPNNRTVGGSCRVGILWFQIEQTAKQFPEVQEVRFLPEELFQP